MRKSIQLLALASLFSIPLFMSGCATPEQEPDPQDETFDGDMCSEQMGYERGVNDGRYGRDMKSKFLLHCRDDLRASAQKGYRDGYDIGRKMYNEEVKTKNEQEAQRNRTEGNQPNNTTSHFPNVNINIGKGSQTVGVGGSGSSRGERAYYCFANVFMTTFEEFGPTLLETKKKVIDACAKRYHRMHCDEVQCQKNE